MHKLNQLCDKFTMYMKSIIYIIVLLSFSLCHIKIGDSAPSFSLLDQNKKLHSLELYKGKNIVLYFYPKNFTPGCTMQACSLRDINNDLKEKDVVVLGVSYDSSEKHEGFSTEYKLNFPLLSDNDKSVSKSYDSNGWFFPKRKTFIINQNGIIIHIIDPVDINTHNDVILSVIDSLQTEKTK